MAFHLLSIRSRDSLGPAETSLRSITAETASLATEADCGSVYDPSVPEGWRRFFLSLVSLLKVFSPSPRYSNLR